jgi:hypothetical protein
MMSGFTFAKFLGAILTIIIVALIKYYISGNLSIDYSDFGGNVGIGLIGWTINTGLIGMLTEYLGLKGLNFNLHQFIFGLDTMKMDGASISEITKPRHKLYNAMESDDVSGNTPSDKGKGIDRQVHPAYTGGEEPNKVLDSDTQQLNKGKKVVPEAIHWGPCCTEPPLTTWRRIFPGADFATMTSPPKTINPGPGFNVPGTVVPLRDEICQHIGWNSNILNQYKNMDLETAVTQRHNTWVRIQNITKKVNYARELLENMPDPTTQQELDYKNKWIAEWEEMSKNKIESEGRIKLLNSRVEFIEIVMELNNKNNNNNN